MAKLSGNVRSDRPPVQVRAAALVTDHLRSLLFSLGKVYRSPGSSLMTMAVIGIALALPTGLFVLLDNLQVMGGTFRGSAQISLYLKLDVSDKRGQALAERLERKDKIASSRYISRGQALEEYRQLSGFGQALEALDENPLPAVIVVQPELKERAALKLSQLIDELEELPEVELAQLDMEWVERLFAIMAIAQRGVLVISALFSLAVLLVVGNTIRLDIQNRRQEIVVTKLIGATDAFIRRPFLYGGFWYGAIGGLMAWVLVAVSLQLVSGPVGRLALLYNSSFELEGLSLRGAALLLVFSSLLGLAGSWVAVGRHLDEIEPT
jgi:cell division transport system permease protein